MFNNCSKLAMEMRTKPVIGLQVVQQLFKWWTSKLATLDFLPEILLPSQKRLYVTKFVDATRPVVRENDVERSRDLTRKRNTGVKTVEVDLRETMYQEARNSNLFHSENFQVSHMIHRPLRVVRVWWVFIMALKGQVLEQSILIIKIYKHSFLPLQKSLPLKIPEMPPIRKPPKLTTPA